MFIETQIRHQLLQPVVFILELPQPLRLVHIQPAELRLPSVNGVLRDAHLPAYVLGRPPRFQLLQRPDDLRLTVLSLRHDTPPRSAESYTLSCGWRGAGHPGVALNYQGS